MKIDDKKLQEKVKFEPHWGQQKVIEAFDSNRETLLRCGRRWGKALDVETDIFTTNGMRKLKDIEVGDYVFGDDGKPAKVLKKSETYENRKCFKVTFSDGAEIVADASHDWVVETKSYRKNKSRTPHTSVGKLKKTTEEMSKDFLFNRSDGGKEHNYSIQTTEPLVLPQRELPIEPYFLGLWLGDGNTNSVGVTTTDEEVILYLQEYAERLGLVARLRNNTVSSALSVFIVSEGKQEGNLQKKLRDLGVLNNKHIPEDYLTSSYEQRMELLKGLMDTDGYIDIDGYYEYTSVSKELAESVYRLLITFGIKPTINKYASSLNGKECRPKYRIHFSTALDVFDLPRKKERLKTERKSDIQRRFIVNIEEVESRPVQCLTVDNESHLFLAGKELIATHNSYLCSYLAVREALYPDKRIWLVAPNYDLASIVFDTCSRFIGTLLSEKSFKLSKNPRSIIELQHGSIIEVKSAENPVSLLGRSTDLVILDEAARLHKYIWDEYIYPTTHERKGKVIYISTPMGQNWFYDKEIELGDSASFHFTSLDNPYFSKEEYDRAKEGVSERIFRNMYEAEYMSDKESVFSGVDEIIAGTWKGPIPGHHYIIGVDIGRRTDPTVVTVIDRNTNEVVYIDSFKDEFPLQKEKIKKLSVNYNNGKIILESTGVGDPILGDFQRQGVFVEEFRTAGHNKMQLIDKLSLFIQEKAIKIPPHEQLIKELKWFQAVVPEASHTNYVKYCAPRGKSDDHVMSLALAVWDLQTYEGMDENRNNTDISRYRKSHKVFNEYE